LGKLIFISIIVLLVYWLIKARKHTSTKIESLADASEDMVRCAYCGVHLPESESIANEDNFFCSNEHLHKYLASKS
jgi:uncharacterized protein